MPSSASPLPPAILSVNEVRERMRRIAPRTARAESVGLAQALGRVLASDIVSPIDVPAHDNAAMDGWALRGIDLAPAGETVLRETGSALAGRPYEGVIGTAECVRIMTGAVMPAGCDTVIPQELVCPDRAGGIVIPAGAVRPGEHRRLRGEDLAAGTVALGAGRVLRPADLGLLASLGIAEAPVYHRLRVAIFSTGDELRAPGQALEAGCIYDSNRYTLHGMLNRLGCEVLDLGQVNDDPLALEHSFRRACESADAVIASGGVAGGAADFSKQVMAQLGTMHFWRIAMRPGQSLAFGTIASSGKEACLFGLPGNPVATMVSFYVLVRDILLHMMGALDDTPPPLRVPTQEAIRKKPGRAEYQRAILSHDATGRMQVRLTGAQGSGILRSMSEANCMVVLGPEQENVEPGELVDVLVFHGLA